MLEALLVSLARGPGLLTGEPARLDACFESEFEQLGLQVCLAETPLETGQNLDLPALHSEYESRYARAVANVSEQLGEPFFQGSCRAPRFPPDLRADQASCWHRPLGMVYLALASSPQNLRLMAGARPRLLPQRSETPTLGPPPDEP